MAALHTFGVNGLVSRRCNGATGFYVFDPSGNGALLLDSSGNVAIASVADSFGNTVSTGGNVYSVFMGQGGQWGYYQDAEDGLTLLGHRFYDRTACRFLTRDPIDYNGGINLYAYTRNNPVNDADPDGFIGQASTDNPDGAIVARQCTEETGSSGLGEPGRILPYTPLMFVCKVFPWLCPRNATKGGQQKKTPRTTGHRQTGDVPSWVPAARQRVGLRGTESCAQYVARLLNDHYGGNSWYTGRKDTRQGSEYSQIVKDCENNPGRYP